MSIQVECPKCHRRWSRGTSACRSCQAPMREGRGVVYWVDAMDGTGRRIRRRIGRDVTQAELVDSEITVARLKGIGYTVLRRSKLTLGALAERYAQSPAIQGHADLRKRLGYLSRVIGRLGVLLPVSSLTPALIHRYQEQRQADGVTGTTINHETGYLHIALEWAVRTGLIEDNPITGYQRVQGNPARERILTDAEYLAIAAQLPPHALPIFELRYRLPFRGQDVIALRVEHVHLKDPRGYIEVPGPLAKSGKPRIIPLWWPHLREMLQAVIGTRAEGPLWLYNGRPLKTWRDAFTAACRRAGVKDFREADLRHCAITLLGIEAQVPLHELARASDQRSLLIQARYTNPAQDLLLGRRRWRYNPVTGVIEATGPSGVDAIMSRART